MNIKRRAFVEASFELAYENSGDFLSRLAKAELMILEAKIDWDYGKIRYTVIGERLPEVGECERIPDLAYTGIDLYGLGTVF